MAGSGDGERVARRVERVRALRTGRGPDPAAGGMFAALSRSLGRQSKRLGGASAAWEAVCPGELLGRTAIRGVSGGVLTVAVADAPARHELGRLLRSGGEARVIAGCPMTVRRVKLVPDASLLGGRGGRAG